MRLACECPCATAKFLDGLSDHKQQRYGGSVGKSMNAVELASFQRVVVVTSGSAFGDLSPPVSAGARLLDPVSAHCGRAESTTNGREAKRKG